MGAEISHKNFELTKQLGMELEMDDLTNDPNNPDVPFEIHSDFMFPTIAGGGRDGKLSISQKIGGARVQAGTVKERISNHESFSYFYGNPPHLMALGYVSKFYIPDHPIFKTHKWRKQVVCGIVRFFL
jgi:hypothetical protein